MNWDRIEGNWKQFEGKAREKFGKLTNDDLQRVNGKKDQLVGRIQERYGIVKDEASRQVDEWMSSMHDDEKATQTSNASQTQPNAPHTRTAGGR